MADDNRWSDRDRDWRDDRSGEGRDRGRGGSYGARGQGGGGDFGRGGYGNRGYQTTGSADERWRQMHQDRRHEGPAGYNDSGPAQGGWEFGDEEQGGARGQGYERYGYGRGGQQGRPYASQGSGYSNEYGRDPGVGSGYGETYGSGREYGRGGGQYGQSGQGSQRWRSSTDRRGYGETYGGAGYGGFSSESQTAYGAHTPYGYRGRNEYDERGRGGEYADDGRRDGEHRSWLERAGERVAGFFGADDSAPHRGRGPKGYRRSDDRIRDDINDRLTDDPWLDASNINVEVRECEVILSGKVDSREDKRRAEDLAETISGVKNVQNTLRVEGQEGRWDDQNRTTTTGQTTGTTGAQTASSPVQNVSSGKDQKGLTGSTGRQAGTE